MLNNQKQPPNQRKINRKRQALMIRRKTKKPRKTRKTRKIRKSQKRIKQQLQPPQPPPPSIQENITHWLARPAAGYLGIRKKKKIT
jgi:hypothetical protein